MVINSTQINVNQSTRCKYFTLPNPHSFHMKVVIGTRIRLQDTFCQYVGDKKFSALNVAVFEELTFDYGIWPLQESPKKTPKHNFIKIM